MLSDLLTIVVICYDPYDDAIKLSPYFLNKYWPNRDVKTVFVTSETDVELRDNMVNVKTHGDLSYDGRLKAALKEVKTKYVLLLVEDYLINKPIDSSIIQKDIDFIEQHNVHFFQLCTIFNNPRGKSVGNKIRLVSPNVRYRLNLQPAIFSKELLEQLINTNPDTAWKAELIFMDSSFDKYDAYFASNKSFSIINFINKGMVTREARRFLKKQGKYETDRKVMPISKTIIKKLSVDFNFVRYLIPKKMLNKMKDSDGVFK